MPSRDSTARDYRERINRVIFYIEAHLGDPLNLDELARVACFSPYHFHRVFVAFTGETLAGFVRRLRLERAAQYLLHLDASVTEIALGAGYETPSAFTRAFVALFGVTPTDYRQRHEPISLLGVRPLALTAMTEDLTMTPEIRTIDPMPVLFVRRTYEQIFKAWLPGSGEKPREEPCFELYLNSPDQVKPEDLRTEIWLPLQ